MNNVPLGYTLEELQEDARTYWESRPLTSVESFRTLALKLANQIVDSLNAEQYEAARALMFMAAEGRRYATNELLLAEQEQWELKNLLAVASSAIITGDFEESVKSGLLALEILAHRIERQRALGIELRPCTEARLAALGTLAASIWEQPLPADQLPIHPSRLASGYESIHRRIMWFIRHKLSRDSEGKRRATVYVEQLAIHGLNICKALARYAPAMLPSVIAKYNEAQHPTLAAEPWHFKLHRPLRPESWYYWDFELAKVWIAGQLNATDLEYLERQRELALPTTRMSERAFDGLLSLWDRQHSVAKLSETSHKASDAGVLQR